MRRQSVPGHLSALGEWPGGEAKLIAANFTLSFDKHYKDSYLWSTPHLSLGPVHASTGRGVVLNTN